MPTATFNAPADFSDFLLTDNANVTTVPLLEEIPGAWQQDVTSGTQIGNELLTFRAIDDGRVPVGAIISEIRIIFDYASSGTGNGQARFRSTYPGSTGVLTLTPVNSSGTATDDFTNPLDLDRSFLFDFESAGVGYFRLQLNSSRSGLFASPYTLNWEITAYRVEVDYTVEGLSIDPPTGDIRGGETITITDSDAGFVEDSLIQVRLGGEEAEGVQATWVDESTITFVARPHALGVVDVLVLQDEEVYGTIEDGYEYTDDVFPHIDNVTEDGNEGLDPNNGPITGGTAVTITGRNFVPDMSIYFDGLPATSVVFVNSTQYTCVTPAHTVGPVNVSIVEP